MPWSLPQLQQALKASLPAQVGRAAELVSLCPAQTFGVDEAGLVELLKSRRVDFESLPQTDLEGLCLAQAALHDDPAALTHLNEVLLPRVKAALLRRATPAEVDEALQQLRIRMLVARDGQPARLQAFSGRGPLVAYLRIAAANLMLNERRPGRMAVSLDGSTMADTFDIAQRLVKSDQQAAFKAVFRDAVQVLSARERSLLRMSLIDGLSIDEIAPMYQVHRATVARWLEAARERLAAVTRSRLAQALKLEPDAVDSLLASVQNGFDLSLSQALSSQVDSEG